MRVGFSRLRAKVWATGIIAGLACLCWAAGAAWAADAYIDTTTLKASQVLPPTLLSGPHFKVQEKVPNDGFFNSYTVKSDYGTFKASSTLALRKLIQELGAISQMVKLQSSESFAKSFEASLAKAGKGVKSLFTDPSGTLEGAGKGMSRLFDRVGEMVTGPAASQAEDNYAKQLIGFSMAKREVADKFKVDVYSGNPVLQKHLDRIAWASYAGGATISAGTSMIPGGTGLVLGTSGGASSLNSILRTTPPAELRMQNRDKLKALGMPGDLIDVFLASTVYSPREQTVIVSAMGALKGVGNLAVILKTALRANDRDAAFTMAEMAVMYATYHRKVKKLAELQPFARVFWAKAKDGSVVVALPTDYILWSRRFADGMAALAKESKGKGMELWVTGRLSPQAEQGLGKAGWKIQTQVDEKFFK